jgi:hypothetical protein
MQDDGLDLSRVAVEKLGKVAQIAHGCKGHSAEKGFVLCVLALEVRHCLRARFVFDSLILKGC